jgi:hypothetical protein
MDGTPSLLADSMRGEGWSHSVPNEGRTSAYARIMDDKLTCYYHPNRGTRVTCGRCEKPLCPDCVQHGATGVRCRECLTLSPRERGLADPKQVRRAASAAAAVAIAGGGVLGAIGWVTWLTGLALGFAVGAAAFKASGRHRDVAIQAMAGLLALVGILLGAVLTSFGMPGVGQEIARVLVNLSYYQFVGPAVGAVIGALARFLV